MPAFRFALLLLVLPLAAAARQPDYTPGKEKSPGDSPDTPSAPVVRLAPQAQGVPTRALQYNLLPRRGELQTGNAATLWIRAGQSAREVNKKINYDWIGP